MSSMGEHLALLANDHQWMNDKLYRAAATLPTGELQAERGAFFGSLLGTLNHLITADTIWLQRFAAHAAQHSALDPARAMPVPASLTERFSDDLSTLWTRRSALDSVIVQWIGQLSDDDLQSVLHYKRLNGEAYAKPLTPVLLHFFNHQTHHRGQATTLLSQAGIDIGSTDLLVLITDTGTPATTKHCESGDMPVRDMPVRDMPVRDRAPNKNISVRCSVPRLGMLRCGLLTVAASACGSPSPARCRSSETGRGIP